MSIERLGLIAGNGTFPLQAARSAKERNIEVVTVAFKQETSQKITDIADKVYWINIGQLDKIFKIFKAEGIEKAIMAGQIRPIHLFKPWLKKDKRLKKLMRQARDNRGDSLLKTLCDELEQEGLELLDSSFLLADLLAPEGLITNKDIGREDKKTVDFGRSIAKEIARLGIGQTVVVKDKAVVAVEAVEGTDAAIKRAYSLAGKSAVVVKVSRPGHDMRFDIPVVGPRTIKILKRCGVKILAVEAGKTLLLDKNRLIEEADKANICIFGI